MAAKFWRGGHALRMLKNRTRSFETEFGTMPFLYCPGHQVITSPRFKATCLLTLSHHCPKFKRQVYYVGFGFLGLKKQIDYLKMGHF
jgi:hypothetical protein